MIKCSCTNPKCRIVLFINNHGIEMTNRYGAQWDQRLELSEENIKHLILELEYELKSLKKVKK